MTTIRPTWYLAALLAIVFASATKAAPPPLLVADINTSALPRTIGGRSPATVQGFTYFASRAPGLGVGLWRTDGTPAGTALVKIICPGDCGSDPQRLTAAGSRLFFYADDGTHGTELWVSDGTSAGTHMVADFTPGVLGSLIQPLSSISSLALFFKPDFSVPGRTQLWRSDGTLSGTYPLLDSTYLAGTPTREFFGIAGGRMVFAFTHASYGAEVWATDGSANGTILLKDIQPGALGSVYPVDSAVGSDGRIYFSANGGPTVDNQIWVTDGTSAGTVQLPLTLPTNTFYPPERFTRLGDQIAFGLTPGASDELWRTDGTQAGTFVLTTSQDSIIHQPVSADSKIFFFRYNLDFQQSELWVSDGTPSGTVPLLVSTEGYNPWIASVGDRVIFYHSTPGEGREPWVSDGTIAGTVRLLDIEPGPSESLPFERQTALLASRLFWGNLTSSGSGGLWATDGTTAGTALVYASLDEDSGPCWMSTDTLPSQSTGHPVALSSQLIFEASDGTHGCELWRTDGTADGTSMVADLTPGRAGSFLSQLVALENLAIFPFGTAAEGTELWRTDGTEAGTSLIEDRVPGPTGNPPDALASVGSIAFATVPVPGFFSYALIGTDGATVATLEDGPIFLGLLTPGDGHVFYLKQTFSDPDQIWRRSPAGVVTLMTPPSDPQPGIGGQLVPTEEGAIFFSGYETTSGGEPWWGGGDGSPARLLADVRPGPDGSLSDDSRLFVSARAGNRVYFTADDGVHGVELWVTDGTPAGTLLVADLNPGAASSEPLQLAAAGGALFFVAEDGGHGREVWCVPAPGATPVLLADIVAGLGSSVPRELMIDGTRVYWSAHAPLFGRELFSSDCTPAGTGIVGDIATGPESSNPSGMTRFGSRLYFKARDGIHGYELWALPVEAIFTDGFEGGDTSAWSLTVP